MRRPSFLPLVFVLAAGCGPKHHLDQYQFSEHSLALVYIDPPAPELLSGWYHPREGDNAIQAVVRAGGDVAREVEARRASARLDSAARRVDIPALLARRTLERASRYLGTHPVDDPGRADYLLEVHMRAFGIDARPTTAAYLFTKAEAVLLDRRTGREIWRSTVNGSDRLTPHVQDTGDVPSSVITAATLGTVRVADFQVALEQLSTWASDLITNDLRDKLRDVRDR